MADSQVSLYDRENEARFRSEPDEDMPNQYECICCHREFIQDPFTRKYYWLEDLEDNGIDHIRRWFTYSLNSFESKDGWVCSTVCYNDHAPEEE